jgi:ankyrin repeat protein
MGLLRALTVGWAVLFLSGGLATGAPLHDAAAADDRLLALKLLKAGADINERDETGATPLFVAARMGLYEMVDLLVLNQADTSIRDNDGFAPLHAAAMSGNASVLSFFVNGPDHNPEVKVGIDDNANTRGVTALAVAAEAGHNNLVAYLIGFGADVEVTDSDGYTALSRVGPKGQEQLVTILLRSRATCQAIDPVWKAECDKRKAALGL